MNDGKPILLSENVGNTPEAKPRATSFTDTFRGKALEPTWYQLRIPYTNNYRLGNTGKDKKDLGIAGHQKPGGVTLYPNVFTLSDRDTPAALFRKQKSLNMTFSATLLPTDGSLGYRQSVGISAYLSEFQHQDVGIRGCVNQTGMCFYSNLIRNGTTTVSTHSITTKLDTNLSPPKTKQIPLNSTTIPSGVTLQIRAEPLKYTLGYQIAGQKEVWVDEIESKWLAFGPAGTFVFEGANWALFGSGNGNPWPFNAPEVGFLEVKETYFEENIPDYDRWD